MVQKLEIFTTPLWRALLPLSFSVFVYGMNGAIYNQMATEQLGDSVYKVVNGADSLTSIITFAVSGMVGELSQPSRLGRKSLALFLSVMEIIPLAVLHLTFDFKAYLWVRMLMACVGISRATEGLSIQPVIVSWITDWAREEQKLRMYSFLTGGIFIFYAIGPLISGALMQMRFATMESILFVTLVMRAAQPFVLLAYFPSEAETRELAVRNRELCKSSSTSQEFQDGTNGQQIGNLREVMSRAWAYLLTEQRDVVVVSLLLTMVGKSFLKNSAIFMSKELGMETYECFYVVGTGCAVAIAMQLSVVPCVNSRLRPSPQIMLLCSVIAQLLHLLVIAFARTSRPLWATMFLPGVIVTADPVVASVIASCGDEGGLSQGAKQGALSGMRIAAASLGPITYTMVEAAKGARAAWLSQGLLVLPALLLLLRQLWKRRAPQRPEDVNWAKQYKT